MAKNIEDSIRELYINQWSVNSKQHYDSGDYEWVCAKIKPYKKILEIGCGCGYCTLDLVQYDHNVIAIDSNPFAIKSTEELLESEDWDVQECKTSIDPDDHDVCLWNIDIVRQQSKRNKGYS